MANGQIPQAQFLSQLRSKYPAYEEIPDSTLLDAILKKYPQYKEQIDFDAPTTTDDAEVSFDPSADGYDYETDLKVALRKREREEKETVPIPMRRKPCVGLFLL